MAIWSLDEHATWRDVLRFAEFQGDREWVYIITGRSGPTGKTFLYDQLKKNGYNAIEISEDLVGLVDYRDNKNHYFVDHAKKKLIIVFNKPIYTKGSKPWNGRKDFTMKKNFTKKDLKNGDMVMRRNGDVEIVCLDIDSLVSKTYGSFELSNILSDLTSTVSSEWDIIAVRRCEDSEEWGFDAFTYEYGEIVYERKDVEEMTLDEICKALGKEIKIVKGK